MSDESSGCGVVVMVLTALAAIATILTFVFSFDLPNFDPSIGSGGGGSSCSPQIELSRGAGPSGTEVSVTGTGFFGDEEVDLTFHTVDLAPARTDADGNFTANVVIPGSLDPFAPDQFTILASTRGCVDTNPFQLEAR